MPALLRQIAWSSTRVVANQVLATQTWRSLLSTLVCTPASVSARIYISEPRISCLIFQPISVISWRTDVNANQLSGINMGSLGRFGYLFVNNTENSGSHGTLSRERH